MPLTAKTEFYDTCISDFDKVSHIDRGGLGGRSYRFDYVPNKRREGLMPSPDFYSSINQPTNKFDKFSKQNGTFGTSRYHMKKLYID